jgi:hypothetical protein
MAKSFQGTEPKGVITKKAIKIALSKYHISLIDMYYLL